MPSIGFLAVASGGAGAQLLAKRDIRDITHRDRHSVSMRDDDPFECLHLCHLSGRPDQVLLPVSLDVAGAKVCIVLFERANDVVEGEPIGQHPRGVRRDVELLLETADGVDLGDACYLAQLRADHPVLKSSKRGRVVRLPIWLPRVRFGMNGV